MFLVGLCPWGRVLLLSGWVAPFWERQDLKEPLTVAGGRGSWQVPQLTPPARSAAVKLQPVSSLPHSLPVVGGGVSSAKPSDRPSQGVGLFAVLLANLRTQYSQATGHMPY